MWVAWSLGLSCPQGRVGRGAFTSLRGPCRLKFTLRGDTSNMLAGAEELK